MNANNEHGTVASFSRLLPESHTPLDSRDGHVSLEDEQTIFRQMHMGKQATSPPKQEEIRTARKDYSIVLHHRWAPKWV